MIIRLLSRQIPLFWDPIKFALVQADEVDDKYLQPYLNEILHALLSDKAQCFIIMKDDRTLTGIFVTRILVDKVTSEKYLQLQSAYSWEKQSNETWTEGFLTINKLAKAEQCKYITFQSRNPVIWKRAEEYGVGEYNRVFRLRLD